MIHASVTRFGSLVLGNSKELQERENMIKKYSKKITLVLECY